MESKRKYQQELAARLLTFVNEKKWSKGEFAEKVGIHASHVAKYLRGEFDPINLLDKLTENSIDRVWFLTGIQTNGTSYNFGDVNRSSIGDKAVYNEGADVKLKTKIADLTMENDELRKEVERLRAELQAK